MKLIDHIAIFENAYSKEICNHYVDLYQKDIKRFKRNSEHIQDESINLKYYDELFLEVFWRYCYPKYAAKHSMLNLIQGHRIYDTKLQKTKPGEGYHQVHCELSDIQTRNRILAFILYLNTVEEGETYFPDQDLKINPMQGKLVIWPAYFTHPHKGLPPKQDKYIITGWVEFGS
tara:strand:- start:2496 stop:3017 length:522 start_codon:yes stop_codon:yes gene_type:complete